MYLFFLVLFILISFVLIAFILLQPRQGFNKINNFSSKNNLTLFGNMYRNNLVINIISIFSFLFLIFSIILCNINNNTIKSNFFQEQNTKIINYHQKLDDIKK
ncbi:preprotein translocase subunit SecG [Buchnera aphidicola]|uniref:preprotein translocase subunit SecG n=1 Tax=Buchnera aphidicola TaxID=9 RepID=UPI003463967D